MGDGCRDGITVPEGWSLVCSLVLGPDAHPRVSLRSYSKKEQEAGKRKSAWERKRRFAEVAVGARPACRALVPLQLSCRAHISRAVFSLILKEVIPNRGLH